MTIAANAQTTRFDSPNGLGQTGSAMTSVTRDVSFGTSMLVVVFSILPF